MRSYCITLGIAFIFGENCVLAGAGIDHEYFVSLANKYFQNLPDKSATSITRPKSKYTGGMLLKNVLKPSICSTVLVIFLNQFG